MGQQEHEAFKGRLREWMDSHAGEYDAFVAGMNRRDDFGYQTILTIAIGLAPEYEAIVNRRVNRGPDGDITADIETLFAGKGLAEALTGDGLGSHLADVLPGDFPDIAKAALVPAMLSWLYFGQSFERMVERGEELRRSPEIPYHEKMLIIQMIQMLVDQSVELGLCTKKDWAQQHKWMKLADSNEDALGMALADDEQDDEQTDEQPDEKRKPGRPSTAGVLAESPRHLLERLSGRFPVTIPFLPKGYLSSKIQRLWYSAD